MRAAISLVMAMLVSFGAQASSRLTPGQSPPYMPMIPPLPPFKADPPSKLDPPNHWKPPAFNDPPVAIKIPRDIIPVRPPSDCKEKKDCLPQLNYIK